MKRLFLTTVPILLAAFFSCESPFALRDPEPPETSQSTWIPPLSPEQVLSNLQSAIYERNVENFTRCIVDPSFIDREYRFEPDAEIAVNYAELFGNWDRDRERTVMQQAFSLVPQDSSCFLEFIDMSSPFNSSDSAVYIGNYKFVYRSIQADLPGAFEGRAEYWLAPDRRGEWGIYRWQDNRLSGSTPWSHLKANLGG